MRTGQLVERLIRAGLFLGCALRRLVNPYGFGLWSFLQHGQDEPARDRHWMPLFSMPWPIVAYVHPSRFLPSLR